MMAVQSPPSITFGKFRHVDKRPARVKSERYATFSAGELDFIRPLPDEKPSVPLDLSAPLPSESTPPSNSPTASSSSFRRSTSHSSPSSPRSPKQPKGVLRIVYSKSRSMSFSPTSRPDLSKSKATKLVPPDPPVDTFVPPPPPPPEVADKKMPQSEKTFSSIAQAGSKNQAVKSKSQDRIDTKRVEDTKTDASLLELFPDEGPQKSEETETVVSLSHDSPTHSDSGSGTPPSYRPRPSRFLAPDEPCVQLPVIPFPSPSPATQTSFFSQPSQSQSQILQPEDRTVRKRGGSVGSAKDVPQTGLSQGRELAPEDQSDSDYYSSLWQSMKDEYHRKGHIEGDNQGGKTRGPRQSEIERDHKEIGHELSSDLAPKTGRILRDPVGGESSFSRDHSRREARSQSVLDRQDFHTKAHAKGAYTRRSDAGYRDGVQLFSQTDDHSRRKERLNRIDNATYPPPPFQAHRLSYHTSHSLLFSKSHQPTVDSQYAYALSSSPTSSTLPKPTVPTRPPPGPSHPVSRTQRATRISPKQSTPSQSRPPSQSVIITTNPEQNPTFTQFRAPSHSVILSSEHGQFLHDAESEDESGGARH